MTIKSSSIFFLCALLYLHVSVAFPPLRQYRAVMESAQQPEETAEPEEEIEDTEEIVDTEYVPEIECGPKESGFCAHGAGCKLHWAPLAEKWNPVCTCSVGYIGHRCDEPHDKWVFAAE